ncbi:uncharacterized protein [Malus domestica]|uniref:uncharacterized protein isoform X3 n=1 Tax=Malus domestica TaxID=3750 RepID=UPI0039751520
MFKSQKARDAKDRLETVASQAQKMNDIVTEQWIQIQRLEQAFHSTQDDAHIFCRESQVKDEVKGVLHFIQYTYNIFGFSFDLKLSTQTVVFLILRLLFPGCPVYSRKKLSS